MGYVGSKGTIFFRKRCILSDEVVRFVLNAARQHFESGLTYFVLQMWVFV